MINDLRKLISPEVKQNEPLALHTTYKIGGPADYFFEAKTGDEAMTAWRAAKVLGVPVFILGGGSNILVSDDGFRGLVVRMSNHGITIDGTKVIAEAGATPGMMAQKTVEAGLTGFEWAVGLPGTIGGAVRGNAGMWGSEIKDTLLSVAALHNGDPVTLSPAECGLAYRDSRLKQEEGWLILSAEFQLKPNPDVAASRQLMLKYLSDKQTQQPLDYPSAGCVFKNWKPESEEQIKQLRKCLDLNQEEKVPISATGTISAAWIIDRLSLKGMKVGHATVSEKHANFLVSDGQADASNVISLIAALKSRVRDATDGMVQLVEEVQFVGF